MTSPDGYYSSQIWLPHRAGRCGIGQSPGMPPAPSLPSGLWPVEFKRHILDTERLVELVAELQLSPAPPSSDA